MNHRRRLSVFFILWIIALLALSLSETEGIPGNPAETKTPASGDWIVARVYFSDRSVLNRLAEYLDIFEVHHPEKYIVAMLSPEQYQNLQTKGLRLEMDPIVTRQVNLAHKFPRPWTEVVQQYPCYRSVDEIYASMSHLANQYPGIASWNNIGDSWEKWSSGGTKGYELKVLVLTNQSKPSSGKSKFFLMGAIHAREMAAGEAAARFAEVLAAEYGRNPDVTWILDYGEVHIMPIANPDGRKWVEQGLTWHRKNTNTNGGACPVVPPSTLIGTDLNRNNSSHWGEAGSSPLPCDETYRGSAAASEPETKAIQDYLTSTFPDQRGPNVEDPAPPNATGLFITLHSYGNLVLFPWGWTNQMVPNHSALQTRGRKFAFFNHYTVQQAYSLYPTSGTTDDWVYDALGVASFTFEVGPYGNFSPDCQIFEEVIWKDNLAALLYAAKAARTPYQTPAGPEMINVDTDKHAVIAGTRVYLNAIGNDNRFYGGAEPYQPLQAARYSVDACSWSPGAVLLPLAAKDGSFNAEVEVVEAWIDTTGWMPGRHILLLEGKDADGIWGPPTAVFLDILNSHRSWLPVILN